MSEIISRPKAAVGVFITNDAGEILLIRSPKWKNKLVPPSGHIEYGETVVQAAVREVKEETGLDITSVKLLDSIDMIEEKDFIRPEHFVGLELSATLAGQDQTVQLEKDEASEYVWASPEDLVRRDDLERWTKRTIEEHFVKTDECDQCREYKAGWQRAMADYKNLQKEIEARRSEWVRMSEAQILEEFLPVYDNFKKAFGQANGGMNNTNDSPDTGLPKLWQNWKQGIEYIMKQFGDVLKRHGIEEIKTVGEQFDATRHEAVGEEIVDGQREGVVVRQIEAGYLVGGRILKVAKVIIAKKKD